MTDSQTEALMAKFRELGLPISAEPTLGEKPKVGKESADDAADRAAEEATPQMGFDPAPLVERLNVWWLNGKDRYFRVPEDGPVLSLSEKDIKRDLRIAGVFSRAPEGRAYSQADLVMNYIQQERHVDYAGPLAGKRIGLFNIQGRRFLITNSFALVKPSPGDWPTLRKVLEGMLVTREADQRPMFYGWLKVGVEALMRSETRPGHALVLAGPSDCGKSFVQEHVITPLLGGRSADPTKSLLGKTQFNAEMVGAEHLAMQELPSGLDHKSRSLFREELKRIIATESHALHPKYCDAVTVYPWWRVSLSINNNVDTLKALPALTSDFGDKVLLLLCESHPENMAGPSSVERRAFREAIQAELPAFVNFLLSWQIPEELQKTKHAARFGLDHFHHPELTAALFEQEPQNSLLYILDNCNELYADSSAWGWCPAKELEERLCEDARFGGQARKLFSFANACGTYLSKLQEKFPKRFLAKHTKKGNLWLLYRSGAEPEEEE